MPNYPPVRPELSDAIKEFTASIPSIYPEFVKELQAEIIEKSKKSGIDINKYCFDVARVNQIKQLSKKQQQPINNPIPNPEISSSQSIEENSTTRLSEQERKKYNSVIDALKVVKNLTPSKANEELIQALEEYLQKNFPNIKESTLDVQQQPKRESKLSEQAKQIIENARKIGSEKAQEAVHQRPKQEEKKEEPEKKTQKSILEDRFIIDKETGAVIDQRNLSIYQKAVNIASATKERVDIKDEIIQIMQNEAVQRYISNLESEKCLSLQQVYGAKWQEVLAQAFEEGYKIGMTNQLEKAYQEGKNKPIKETQKPVDFEELNFVYESFDIKTKDTGEVEVINKKTNQVVKSERTKTVAIFAKEWVNAAGSVIKEGEIEIIPEQAFTPENRKVYNLIQSQFRNDLTATGNLNIEELRTNAQLAGPGPLKTTEILLRNPKIIQITDKHFRIQNPNAIKASPEAYEDETKSVSK